MQFVKESNKSVLDKFRNEFNPLKGCRIGFKQFNYNQNLF